MTSPGEPGPEPIGNDPLITAVMFDWRKPIRPEWLARFPDDIKPHVLGAIERARKLAREHGKDHGHELTPDSPFCSQAEAVVNLLELVKAGDNLTTRQKEGIVAVCLILSFSMAWVLRLVSNIEAE